MEKKDVPQHEGVLDRWKQISYATDESGRYVLEQSAGWNPANQANRQAWELIRDRLEEVAARVKTGDLSPLAFHMERNQMDATLLARYSGIARWRVRRHLRPDVFASLPQGVLERYARLFEMTVEELRSIPERVDLPLWEETGLEGSHP